MATAIRLRAPGGADQLESVTIELPPPQPDEIRIRQTAIGVNFIDIYQRSGLYPLPPPAIPGVEAVGVVTAVGANVTSSQVGDRVAYAGAPVGAYVSERNLPAWRAINLPDTVSDASVAAVFVKGITAYMLLQRVHVVGPGTVVLIHSAAGGLGQLLTRWARHLGAIVIGTVGSDIKAETARHAGAHHVIVGRDADFARAVADLTEARGVDVAYDGVGGSTLANRIAGAYDGVPLRIDSSAATWTSMPLRANVIRSDASSSTLAHGCSAYSSPYAASRRSASVASATVQPPLASTRTCAAGPIASRTAATRSTSSWSRWPRSATLTLAVVHPSYRWRTSATSPAGTAGTVALTGTDVRTGSGHPTHPASSAAASQRDDSTSSYSGNGANSPHPFGPRISAASRTITPLNPTRIGMLTTLSPSITSASEGNAEVMPRTSLRP